jgi:hypothetical protein
MFANSDIKDVGMSNHQLERFEGRLFAKDGHLHFVVSACEATNTARVSCRVDGERKVLELTLTEVRQLICTDSDLALDNANGGESAKRIVHNKDGWYFSAREGQMGPYTTESEAEKGLSDYIVSAQSKTAAG